MIACVNLRLQWPVLIDLHFDEERALDAENRSLSVFGQHCAMQGRSGGCLQSLEVLRPTSSARGPELLKRHGDSVWVAPWPLP